MSMGLRSWSTSAFKPSWGSLLQETITDKAHMIRNVMQLRL